jgi:sugar transferase (PEP-CTERM/EpsH1 system associated)
MIDQKNQTIKKERILFISHRIPYPPNKGDKIRSFHELRYFSQHYDVDLVSFYDTPGDKVYEYDLKQFCTSVFLFPIKRISSLIKGFYYLLRGRSISIGCYYDKRAMQTVDSLIKKNDYLFIFCYSSQVAQYAKENKCPRIIDFIDVDSDKWKQYAQKSLFPLSLIYNTEHKRLSQYEKQIWKEFSLSVFCTQQEQKLFRGNSNPDKISVFSNGVDHTFFSPQNVPRENSIVFTGAMDYYPNIDAVLWFCQNIFPEIIKKNPQVRFYIVGSNPAPRIRRLASENIIITGFVKDIRPYIAAASLAVYPLRIARGIQNKILEAMSMGITPVIPSSLKSSLDEEWPQGVLIYHNEEECIRLILDNLQTSATKTSDTLRDYILQNRDWGKRLTHFHSEILKCVTVQSEQISSTEAVLN